MLFRNGDALTAMQDSDPHKILFKTRRTKICILFFEDTPKAASFFKHHTQLFLSVETAQIVQFLLGFVQFLF